MPAAGLEPEPGRRPLVAVVAENDGTETTDFLVPYGILASSEAVDLVAVSMRSGPVALHPALTVELPETSASFDAQHPQGADFVIVPAMHRADDPQLLAWLTRQAERGATLVGICDGVWSVARTGVLAGKRATGHWYSLDDLQATFPETTWVRDSRYVRDGSVITTTGVTASLPATIAIVESIAGRPAAAALAERLGVREWSAAHDSNQFALSARDVATAARNWLGFWRYEQLGIPVDSNTDEISLALTADALSRTYRSTAVALAPSSAPLRLKHGILLHPTVRAAGTAIEPLPAGVPPALALDLALAAVERRYGAATADFVGLQIEYPQRRLQASTTE